MMECSSSDEDTPDEPNQIEFPSMNQMNAEMEQMQRNMEKMFGNTGFMEMDNNDMMR